MKLKREEKGSLGKVRFVLDKIHVFRIMYRCPKESLGICMWNEGALMGRSSSLPELTVNNGHSLLHQTTKKFAALV